ncbi:hypothetical protein BDN70DRAFT_665689 [Pholiota conissans]|uniref:Uncharacterized protein n=1 Tax=Pholiota conissans TaxID=109636 RepID=A0A9P5YIT9_9AGAR|nr:hypothetical protein BDN70DRAFT_665689 [Pholiota conissans]
MKRLCAEPLLQPNPLACSLASILLKFFASRHCHCPEASSVTSESPHGSLEMSEGSRNTEYRTSTWGAGTVDGRHLELECVDLQYLVTVIRCMDESTRIRLPNAQGSP